VSARPFELRRDPFGRLVLILPDGRLCAGVIPVRPFPLSEPDLLVALVDESGREITSVPHLDQLAPDLAALLREELARRELMPEITDILSISGGAEPTTWEVETTRGRTTFVLPAEESVRALDERAVLVTDEHGLRYLIRDRGALGKAARGRLLRYV
jgi:hypothetical protein